MMMTKLLWTIPPVATILMTTSPTFAQIPPQNFPFGLLEFRGSFARPSSVGIRIELSHSEIFISNIQELFKPPTNYVDTCGGASTTPNICRDEVSRNTPNFDEPVYLPRNVNSSQRNLITANSFGLSNNFFLIPSLPIVPDLSGAGTSVNVDYEVNTVLTSQAIGTQSRVVPNLIGSEGSTPLVKSVQIPAISTEGKTFEVIVDNVNLGTFRSGQVINFANFRTQLGSLLVDFEGVRKFKIRVKEDVATGGTRRFPFLVKLEFTKPSASLELRTAKVN
jgi:hypothetical protein